MNSPFSDDPQDPRDESSPKGDQLIRARVPDHVARGAFSTGVIVMTAQTEFVLDFVQNLGRPHQIVARIVMPHAVLPQFVDALRRNIDLYRSRWGNLPSIGVPKSSAETVASTQSSHSESESVQPKSEASANLGGAGNSDSSPAPLQPVEPTKDSPSVHSSSESAKEASGRSGGGTRQALAHEVYDDLKIRDELLSGAYANAVMIGHGPHEFSFDFITNFYPHSAVSSRVFLAAGQVSRLYDSLKGSWNQIVARNRRPEWPPLQNSGEDESQRPKDNELGPGDTRYRGDVPPGDDSPFV